MNLGGAIRGYRRTGESFDYFWGMRTTQMTMGRLNLKLLGIDEEQISKGELRALFQKIPTKNE